jgi:hypothetical protein
MKPLLATAAVTALLSLAPAALAANAQPHYRFYTDNTSVLVGKHVPQAQPGYRFWTDNTSVLVGNTRPVAALSDGGFRWADAGIGASAAIGAVLILLGSTLVLLRKRGRLAL